jgi:hypothetical protein
MSWPLRSVPGSRPWAQRDDPTLHQLLDCGEVAVDLVYLDPALQLRDDNVIFRDESGKKFDTPLLAFEDTWG